MGGRLYFLAGRRRTWAEGCIFWRAGGEHRRKLKRKEERLHFLAGRREHRRKAAFCGGQEAEGYIFWRAGRRRIGGMLHFLAGRRRTWAEG
jgi:hypothetical protein